MKKNIQGRREGALSRLEETLKRGEKSDGTKLTEQEIKRIKKEINILEQKLI